MARLNWGMIGGGEGSQIGPAHRLGAGLDGVFLCQPARSITGPKRAATMESGWGLAADRAYGDWREMLDGEKNRDDRVDLVTVATPNATHFEITKAFSRRAFTCSAKSR
jgi:predicted dehydrogenase